MKNYNTEKFPQCRMPQDMLLLGRLYENQERIKNRRVLFNSLLSGRKSGMDSDFNIRLHFAETAKYMNAGFCEVSHEHRI